MKTRMFEVKEEHIKLLQMACVDWNDCEFGSPSIDPKRPYGSSYVWPDIAKVLNLRPDFDGDWTQKDYDEMSKVHKETETVLQIFLKTGKMETGFYECEEYGNKWTKVDNVIKIDKMW